MMEYTVNYKENKLSISNSIPELCADFTKLIHRELSDKKEMHIALSGGSTPKALFDYWSQNKQALPWEKFRFYWGDERCVPPNNEMSNYGMTKKHLFDPISISSYRVFRIHGENDPEEEAKRYAQIIPQKFDLIILGMGDDGHTASIFPHQITLWDSKLGCVVAEHPESRLKRISITGEIINSAQQVAFLITGSSKAEKVAQIILEREKYVNSYPAAKVQPASKNLHWFLDDAAAHLLPSSLSGNLNI